MQRNQQFDNKPPIASLDFSDHLRQAYWNCVNSLQMFQPMSAEGQFISGIAREKFDECVKILNDMTKSVDKYLADSDYKKASTPKLVIVKVSEYGRPCDHNMSCSCRETSLEQEPDSHELFTAISRLFHKYGVFKEAVSIYGGHL